MALLLFLGTAVVPAIVRVPGTASVAAAGRRSKEQAPLSLDSGTAVLGMSVLVQKLSLAWLLRHLAEARLLSGWNLAAAMTSVASVASGMPASLMGKVYF